VNGATRVSALERRLDDGIAVQLGLGTAELPRNLGGRSVGMVVDENEGFRAKAEGPSIGFGAGRFFQEVILLLPRGMARAASDELPDL
jgi:hypothetical protein